MFHAPLSRREILKTTSCGFGYLALAGLFGKAAAAATTAAIRSRRSSRTSRRGPSG